MIHIIAGGKKPGNWSAEAIAEYQKRLHKPFDLTWTFYPEEKLAKYLENWPFSGQDFVFCCDERGKNLSSPEFATTLDNAIISNKNIIILIGGAYGFSAEVRAKSDLIWGFSRLVFPHALARVIVTEQIYRAQEILAGHPYHHE